MHSLFVFLYLIFTSCYISGSILNIELVRHKSMREQAFNVKNIHELNLDTEWMKPKPKPKPGNDSVALYRYLDSEFYGIVKIGYKAQEFKMVFDTAWADTWVISDECSSYNLACLVHNKYDHTKSSRYKANGTKFFKDLGQYNISGYLSVDDFNVGHTNVSGHTFAEITDLPNIYSLEKADGVIGLAYKSLSEGINPLFYNMIAQGLIKKPIFSVYLNRDKSSNRGGNIILGGIESRHVLKNHTIKYLPVNRTGYWQFKMDRIVMDDGKKSYGYCLHGCQAIADTSTNAILGPYNEILKMNTLIKARLFAHNQYRVKCNTILKLPKLIFTIGNDDFVLHGKDYIQQMGYNFLTLCMSSFQPTAKDRNDDIWFLGGAFFAEYYSIYNLEDNTIGIVKAA